MVVAGSHRREKEACAMLYIAFIRNRPGFATDTDTIAKSRK
jgi:hypothetical protein